MNSGMKCSVNECNVNKDYLLVSIDDGKEKLILCYCDSTEYFWLKNIERNTISSYPTEMTTYIGNCDACNKKGDVVYKTISREKEYVLTLCNKDLERFLGRSLTKQGYFNIRKKFGIFHEIHDDFYTNDGKRVQPREILKP